jgi:uncharacterized damage-inducible protein DinB
MQLKETSYTILEQISSLINGLSNAEYKAELDLLNGNSVGKHVRHIIEFFDLLISGAENGIINYDRRDHEPVFETETGASLDKLTSLKDKIGDILNDKEIILELSYTDSDRDSVKIKSSIERELAYNIEHAVHHMAIIAIAVKTVFPQVSLPENFGVAFSTLRFRKSLERS